MGAKKMSYKIFDYGLSRRTTKSPIFYAISFVATFILTFAKLIFFSNYSLHPFDLITSHEIVEAQNYPQAGAPTESLPKEIGDIQENVEDADDDEEYHDPLIPPENISRKEKDYMVQKSASRTRYSSVKQHITAIS